jgi:hypothetical protein
LKRDCSYLNSLADRKEHNSVFAQYALIALPLSSPKDEERKVARDEYAGNARNLTPPPNVALNPDEIQRSIGASRLVDGE